MILVDPGSGSLVSYGRDGHRGKSVELDDVSLDFSRPMRLESTDDGYVLLSQNLLVELEPSLAIRSHRSPFEKLDETIIPAASINDALPYRGELLGHLDLVDARVRKEDDPGSSGTLRSGFGRVDVASGEWRFLHEFPLEGDGEYASYYLYDRRPYVTTSKNRVYVLRFTKPWSVARFGNDSLLPLLEGPEIEGEHAHSLHAWRGRLYVLSSRVLSPDEAPRETPMPALKKSQTATRAHIELLQAIPSLRAGERQWMLTEIDRRRGKVERRFELPTRAERLRLVPGAAFWTAIEEGAGLNLGDEGGRTSFLFLPGSEILEGRFTCPQGPESAR